MKAIVLAGGKGTRLWPFSRENYPKQLLAIGDKYSYMQQTIMRLRKQVAYRDIHVVTGCANFWDASHQLSQIDPDLQKNIILEPVGRNTAPAIALAYLQMVEEDSISDDDLIFVTPSDHSIADDKAFFFALEQASKIAQKGWITLLGIEPSSAETDYGYIMKGKIIEENAFEVARFIEKPKLKDAEKYLLSNNYLWNAGMLCLTAKTLKSAIQTYLPEFRKFFNLPLNEVITAFGSQKNISFDYAVLEKSNRVAIVPSKMGWSDLGNWDRIEKLLPSDEKGNKVKGSYTAIDSNNCLVIGNKRTIASIEVENLLIIDCDDALLIAKKGSSARVKEVVTSLEKNRSPQVKQSLKSHRPWGDFTLISKEEGYEVRRLSVLPGKTIPPQTDRNKNKNWIIVQGRAEIELKDRLIKLVAGNSLEIPFTVKHSLYNPGKEPLILIETHVFLTSDLEQKLPAASAVL